MISNIYCDYLGSELSDKLQNFLNNRVLLRTRNKLLKLLDEQGCNFDLDKEMKNIEVQLENKVCNLIIKMTEGERMGSYSSEEISKRIEEKNPDARLLFCMSISIYCNSAIKAMKNKYNKGK